MFSRGEIGNPLAEPNRTHYAWHELEEYRPDGGMWSIPRAMERQRFIDDSAALMADPPRFADAMRTALRKWPKSVAHALGNPSLNHRAWLGHAGCYLATGSP